MAGSNAVEDDGPAAVDPDAVARPHGGDKAEFAGGPDFLWAEIPAMCGIGGGSPGEDVSRRRERRRYFPPVGTSRLSSSNQFWTRIISVTGWGFLSSSLTIRNRRPSAEMSHSRIG